jgi:electron transfer flavoprotein alpha subunit
MPPYALTECMSPPSLDRTFPLILVLVETSWEKLERVTFELLADARKLAASVKGRVALALLAAPGRSSQLIAELTAQAEEPIHLVEHEAFGNFSTENYLAGLSRIGQTLQPNVVFLAATANGRDIAPRLAARHNCAYFPHCLMVKASLGGTMDITRITHGGRVHVQTRWPIKSPSILSMKPGVADVPAIAPKSAAAAPFLTRYSIELPPGKARLQKRIPADPTTLDICEAERLVAGGRGVGSKENFAVVRDLAEALGASLAASRAAVDLGWVEYERQVGQTGKSVTPRLYFAAGISGASHHLMGMRDSEKIIAINIDRQAPIFGVAHFGVFGNLHEVLPKLTQRIRKGKSSVGLNLERSTAKL